ncbi:DUF4209 domain-containing protein [Peribacillus frigoritolerans]|uniref:DUF4209 domain-containing protein n=1 Tax=Peribacillus frigoritolerans TaxID=450367 RepID=UPI0030176199
MGFLDFEIQLHQLFKTEGVLSYFGTELSCLDYKDINNEVIIQENLIGFNDQTISNDILNYASERLDECTLFITKTRYFLFLIKNAKKKYVYAKEYVDFLLNEPEEAIENESDSYFTKQCLNTLLEVSGSMNIRTEEVWLKTWGYIQRYPNILLQHASKITSLITNKEREDNFIGLLNNLLLQSANTGNYSPIEQLLNDTSKNKKFPIERSAIQRRLAEAYMKKIEHEESAVRGIHFAQKAASIFKYLKDNEEENKCLAIISKYVESDNSDWEEMEINLPSEVNDAVNENIRVIKEIFCDTGTPIQERISYLSKFITIKDEKTDMSNLLYKPVALIKDVDSAANELNKSVFLQLVSVVTLDQNKVIANGNNAIRRAMELVYPMHKITTILPALEALEGSHDYSIQELKVFIKECPIISDDELIFINEALDDYACGRWIPFICVIVPSFESILRQLYLEIEGTNIQAKNTDPLVHTTVNLTNVLNNKKVRELLSEDLAQYLEYLLNSDTSSENIRNNVAHRFTNSDFYSKDRSQVLIHALVQVCARCKEMLKVV